MGNKKEINHIGNMELFDDWNTLKSLVTLLNDESMRNMSVMEFSSALGDGAEKAIKRLKINLIELERLQNEL